MARSSLAYIPGFSVKFFFQPIYAIGPVFFEEKIKVYDVRRTDERTDGRQVMAKAHMTFVQVS
jgi:hypothetical protein